MFLLGAVVLQAPFRALKRLSALAERIGSGDLSGRVPVKGRDEVASFCKVFNAMADGLCQAREEIHHNHLEAIQAMISAVEAKDSYTQGHCVRVQRYTRDILERLEYSPPETRALIETAALLHDIGKIGIPDSILLKHDRLTRREAQIIHTHVTVGETILRHIESLQKISRWVRHHHERWDGLGYPDGLRGEAAPFASRVIGVADAVDAMLTDRPYRKALGPEEVAKVLEEGKGKQFDPQIVDCAILLLEGKWDDVVRPRISVPES
jgi:putative nucleotidyltransferase with HDIG domain